MIQGKIFILLGDDCLIVISLCNNYLSLSGFYKQLTNLKKLFLKRRWKTFTDYNKTKAMWNRHEELLVSACTRTSAGEPIHVLHIQAYTSSVKELRHIGNMTIRGKWRSIDRNVTILIYDTFERRFDVEIVIARARAKKEIHCQFNICCCRVENECITLRDKSNVRLTLMSLLDLYTYATYV